METTNVSESRRYLVRKPQRICFTLNYRTYQILVKRSLEEGRSLSNLIAHLVERAVESKH